jgi:hypothetical protein
MALRVAELVRGTLAAIPAVGTYPRRTKSATFACWQKNRRAKIKAMKDRLSEAHVGALLETM